MKNLIIAALMVSAASRAAFAAQELCGSGSKFTTNLGPAVGPEVTITRCEWAADSKATLSPAATSLVVIGGSTVGGATIDVGVVRTSPLSLTLSSDFTTNGQLIISGTLPAGSTVSISGCTFTSGSGGLSTEGALLHF